MQESESIRSVGGPWDWQPSFAGWCQGLQTRIADWIPHRALDVDGEAARYALFTAAQDGANWLFHPLCHALFATPASLKNDVQLLTWISFNMAVPLGGVTIEQPLWIWSSSGGWELPVGHHEIAQLARAIGDDEYKLPIALDVWFDSAALTRNIDLGFDHTRLWRNCQELFDDPSCVIEKDVIRFLRILSLICARMPDCARWLDAVTHVVVPLAPLSDASFNSSSEADLPGLIFSDMKDESQIAEALVHESAHHYFRIAEAVGPIVLPEHQATYTSPLRPEPRPLRGVFLAYHALAYICAFFSQAQSVGVGLTHPDELAQLREKSAEAEHTLDTAAAHLTPCGQEFFE